MLKNMMRPCILEEAGIGKNWELKGKEEEKNGINTF